MVKDDQEALAHVIWKKIQHPHCRHRRRAAAQDQHKPPKGKAGNKGHAEEDEEKDQDIAHVPGDKQVNPAKAQGVEAH